MVHCVWMVVANLLTSFYKGLLSLEEWLNPNIWRREAMPSLSREEPCLKYRSGNLPSEKTRADLELCEDQPDPPRHIGEEDPSEDVTEENPVNLPWVYGYILFEDSNISKVVMTGYKYRDPHVDKALHFILKG